KSVGIRGEVKVQLLTDQPRRFSKLKSVWIGEREESAEKLTIESSRIQGFTVVLKFDEIDSRTAADILQGRYVFISAKDVIVPPKGSFFIDDVIGMTVVSEEGEPVGTVKDILQTPANDVWVVQNGTKEVLLPAVKEVIKTVDLKRKEVVIHVMEGLLD
ncbi:MAG: 16S rRNA processing protein RimM, partial [Ignavibacteriales bacterium]|nr:16S rRNA processing protein RimM [Ignavibacteriales bacterium]